MRVERVLDRPHHLDAGQAVAPCRSRRCARRCRCRHARGRAPRAGRGTPRPARCRRRVRIHQHAGVEVAFAHVSHHRRGQVVFGDVGLRGSDAVGAGRDRYADVGRQAGATGLRGSAGSTTARPHSPLGYVPPGRARDSLRLEHRRAQSANAVGLRPHNCRHRTRRPRRPRGRLSGPPWIERCRETLTRGPAESRLRGRHCVRAA